MRFKMNFSNLPKCGAAPKKNSARIHPCKHIALENGRCYYHGGRRPTHGKYTKVTITKKRENKQFIKTAKESLNSLTELVHERV